MRKEIYRGYVPLEIEIDGSTSSAHLDHLNFFNRMGKKVGAEYADSSPDRTVKISERKSIDEVMHVFTLNGVTIVYKINKIDSAPKKEENIRIAVTLAGPQDKASDIERMLEQDFKDLLPEKYNLLPSKQSDRTQ